MTAVCATSITKSYGTHTVLRGVDLLVQDASITALLGPNGAGKTSFVEILEGHRRRDGGHVQVLGLDPGISSEFARLRRHIGVVLQHTALEGGLSVRDLVRRQASYYPAPADIDEVLAALGLTEQARTSVRALSGGLRRRLDIALALVGQPRLLFLDEPTTGLDPLSRRNIRQLVRDLNRTGTTVILTSHDLEEVQDLADRVHLLDDGRIVTEGSPQDLIRASGSSTRVSFQLGAGDPGRLPVGAVLQSGLVRYEVADQATLLTELNRWSSDQGLRLEGLTITQPTLDDAYAVLVGGPGTGGH